MFMRSFLSGKIYLTLVIVQKIQSFLMTNKKVIGKMKDEFGGVIVIEFVGLKSKMYSTKKIDGKESNWAKGVSIATEFDEFKDVLFNEKITRHKMKRIQSKKHKLGTYETDKISLPCFDNKRYVLDDGIHDGIHMLAFFHKDSVTSCKEIKIDCDKKDCNKEDRYNCYKWKKLWLRKIMIIEKIVIIEKNCDNWKKCYHWKK